MSKIMVKEYVKSAFSNDEAAILKDKIQEQISEEKIVLDFEGISQYTTLFFNFSTGFFIKKLGRDKYDSKFEVINLTELGESTYMHSYNNNTRDKKDDEKINNAILDILNNMDEA